METILVRAKILNHYAVGVDINPQSVLIYETNLQFQCEFKLKIFKRNENIQICILLKIVKLNLFILIHHIPALLNIARVYIYIIAWGK